MKTRKTIAALCFWLCAASSFGQPREFDRPFQRDLQGRRDSGPGRRTLEDQNRSWASQKRIARRDERPSNTDSNQEPWWEKEAAANADFSSKNDRQVRNDRGELIRSSQIIAMVGNEPVLAGDLLGQINERLTPYIGQVPESEIDKQRWLFLEQLLPSIIEAKIVYLEFKRTIAPEQIEGIRENIYKQFDEKQLPELVKNAKVTNVTDLEQKMRAVGSSLEKVRRGFFEQMAAREMIRQNVKSGDDIPPDELLEYYRANIDKYSITAESKWEQVMVNAPSFLDREKKADAWTKLSKMGNAIVGGAPLHVVAKRDSDGPNADEGGLHDWTAKGSLVSDVLDKAIFELPVGRLSDILIDDQGFHIVRVIERKGGGHVPFTEAQKEIRESLVKERKQNEAKEYIERLKREAYVWNYFETQLAQKEKQDSILI